MGMNEPLTRLYDMHCHFGFVSDADLARRCLSEHGAHALSCTVSPDEFERDRERFAPYENCRVALGLHPWRIVDAEVAEAELRAFETLVPETAFVGEVGLDLGGRRDTAAQATLQQDVFERVLDLCEKPAPDGRIVRKLLSIHAVHAAGNVLDLLEAHRTTERHDCIFHWFSGTSEELKRAIDIGCSFSVGPRMLATKRGREYARIIPIERLLLETDSPSQPNEPWNCETWIAELEKTCYVIAESKRCCAEDLAMRVRESSARLFTRD